MPEHGIRARKFGATWWGRRWIGALERLGRDYALRLNRGRIYARQGRVHDLSVRRGLVEAQVTGSRVKPYRITVRLVSLADAVWEKAIRAMSQKAAYAARLLAGEMPRDIDETFRRAGRSLFPADAHDLATGCSCPDWANPCKHVAAVHYVLAEFLDRDPFLLFELRGRPRAGVLDALRRLRAGKRSAAGRPGATKTGEAGTVTLEAGAAERYDRLAAPADNLSFHFETPRVAGAILRQLGAPPSWSLPAPPRELLESAVARAATLARELAFGEAAEPAEPAD